MYKLRPLHATVQTEVLSLAPAVLWSGMESCEIVSDNLDDVLSFIQANISQQGCMFRVHKVSDGLVRAYAFLVGDDLVWIERGHIIDGAQLASAHPRYKVTDFIDDSLGYVGAQMIIHSDKSAFKTLVASHTENMHAIVVHSPDNHICPYSPPMLVYTALRECSINGGEVIIRKFKPEPPHEIYYAKTVNGVLEWQSELEAFEVNARSMQQLIDFGYPVDQVNQLSEAFEPKTPQQRFFDVEI